MGDIFEFKVDEDDASHWLGFDRCIYFWLILESHAKIVQNTIENLIVF